VTNPTDGLSPYDRRMAALMAELIPTRPAPALKPEPPPRPPGWWTPAEQARHWQELGEALEGWHWDDDYAETRRGRERGRAARLRAVPDPADNNEDAA
jgi:hypothetical protein